MDKELKDLIKYLSGEHTEINNETKVKLSLILKDDKKSNIVFTNRELFLIYTYVKRCVNFAPEENEDYETNISERIFNKIENHINHVS